MRNVNIMSGLWRHECHASHVGEGYSNFPGVCPEVTLTQSHQFPRAQPLKPPQAPCWPPQPPRPGPELPCGGSGGKGAGHTGTGGTVAERRGQYYGAWYQVAAPSFNARSSTARVYHKDDPCQPAREEKHLPPTITSIAVLRSLLKEEPKQEPRVSSR